jgi:methylated-DNA-[protein]-cysteine S-methyltransferase
MAKMRAHADIMIEIKVSTGLAYGYVATPVGSLLVAGDAEALQLISFPKGSRATRPLPDWRRDDACFKAAFAQLRAYFAKELTQFDLLLKLNGSTFQIEVWNLLREIPYGETTSYGAMAARLGQPTASRAVGAANGANPLPIVLPCHRVIGSDGSLTGFGGGIATKQFLLNHEGARGFQPRML